MIRYKNYAGRVGRAEELRMEESCVARSKWNNGGDWAGLDWTRTGHWGSLGGEVSRRVWAGK